MNIDVWSKSVAHRKAVEALPTNDYRFEFTDADHRALADRLHWIAGFAMVSGYECSLMEELYGDWHKVKFPIKKTSIRSRIKNGSGTVMQECVWCNYEPRYLAKNQQLF